MLRILASLSFALLASFARAEGRAGKADLGVDAVQCDASTASPFSGHYSLDYLATISEFDGVKMPAVSSLAESRNRILGLLNSKIPPLGRLLSDVLRSNANRTDWLEPRIWLDSPYSLVDLNDEDMIRRLPPNCRTPGGGTPKLVQVGVVEKRDGVLVYEFDQKFLAKELSSPLQESMVWFSFALRDHVSDVRMLRRINRLLHSSRLDELDAVTLKTSLARMGLAVPESHFHSVCYRSPSMKEALLATGKARHCTGFTAANLGSSTLAIRPKADLEAADFEHISSISLTLASAAELKLFEASPIPGHLVESLTVVGAQDFFTSYPSRLFKVRSLTLDQFRGSQIPEALLPRYSGLTSLRIEGNSNFKVLRGALFANVFSRTSPYLSLSGGALSHVASSVLDSLPHATKGRLNLAGNSLSADELARIRAHVGPRGWTLTH